VWGIAAETKIQLRDDYAIENYLNDPDSTPEDQLVTEILIPTA
jgi:effector-binding domain-containing protein